MALYTPSISPTARKSPSIKTSKGDIRVQLAGDDAPIHVGNFVELARKGFYDNLKFHRYVPGFVIQGGCPNTRDLDSAQVIEAAGNRGLALARVVRATASSRSTPPTRTTPTKTAHWPWLAARTPILRAPSSICAWVPSIISTLATPCSARLSKVKMSSASFAWAMSLKLSKSKTPTSHKLSRVFKEDRNSWTTNT